MLARLGGDEFAVLLPERRPRRGRARSRDALVTAVRNNTSLLERRAQAESRCSIGIAMFDARAASSHRRDDADRGRSRDVRRQGSRPRRLRRSTRPLRASASRTKARLTWVEPDRAARSTQDRFALVAQPILDLRSDAGAPVRAAAANARRPRRPDPARARSSTSPSASARSAGSTNGS